MYWVMYGNGSMTGVHSITDARKEARRLSRRYGNVEIIHDGKCIALYRNGR